MERMKATDLGPFLSIDIYLKPILYKNGLTCL